MPMKLAVPTPLEYFASLVHSDEGFPLLEAAASIAQDEYPQLDIQQVQSEVDQLVARLQRRLAQDAPALQRLRMLNQFFFADLGFGGNVNNYYDPENSYLNDVLRTRRGIPISLGVLWMELAHGIGLKAHGVAFPGHFMVKAQVSRGQVLIDPFTGQSLSREDLVERLAPFQHGVPEPLQADDLPLGLFLQPAAPRDIIARMLRNLKELHRSNEDWQRLIAVLDRMVILLPTDWQELRDRGLAHAASGQHALALQDLEAYLAHAGDAADAIQVAEQIRQLREN